MRTIFSNRAFDKSLPVKPGQRLPKKLADRLKKEIGKLGPPYPAEPVELEFALGRLPKGEFRLTCVPLTHDVSGLGAFSPAAHWLIRLKPFAGPSAGMKLSLRDKGLSAREIEVAILIRDDIDPREIGKRLFISRHTVKTHLKNIYAKLGVHSRAQLVSFLAKSSGPGGYATADGHG
ncbi:MAG: helix-turn-helix transcriptional regulator [Nitrospinae bacterium]|nr:helix-turn-helix transcriptional regulator [Nitrospinota bacterium]